MYVPEQIWAVISFIPSLCFEDHSAAQHPPLLEEYFLGKSVSLLETCWGQLLKVIYTLYTLQYTQIPRPSPLSYPCSLENFWEDMRPHTVSEFTCFSHCHWHFFFLTVIKRQVCCKLHKSVFFSLFYCQIALLTNVTICHCLFQPISSWLKVFD